MGSGFGVISQDKYAIASETCIPRTSAESSHVACLWLLAIVRAITWHYDTEENGRIVTTLLIAWTISADLLKYIEPGRFQMA